MSAVPPKSCPICGQDVQYKFTMQGFRLYHCPGCLHQFFSPQPKDSYSIYQSEQYFRDGQKHPLFKRTELDLEFWPQYKTFATRANFISSLFPSKNFKLLDVGCGAGLFVKICQKKGIKALGIDISPAAIKLAHKIGSNCYQQEFIRDIASSCFEVITMFDVLEHLPRPLLFLEKAHRVLKKNGLLFLTTLRGDSLLCKIFKKGWHLYIPPRHLNIFSTRSIRLSLTNNGFKTLKLGNQGQWTNIGYAVLKMLSIYGIKSSLVKNLLRQTGMTRLNLYCNLFDVMTICAQKQ